MADSMRSSMNDDPIIAHVLFDQLEGRSNGPDNELRWDGEGWAGTDHNRLWLKSEGFFNDQGKVEDGDHEVLYDRPVTTYFDLQGGLRYDLDSGPQRWWGAFGIEGLAPQFFNFQATAYARDAGHFAGRVVGSYDLLLTQRLIAQPEIEINCYSKQDPSRAVGTGLSEIDTGLRIRYELAANLLPMWEWPTTGSSAKPRASRATKVKSSTICAWSSGCESGTRPLLWIIGCSGSCGSIHACAGRSGLRF